MLGPTVSPVVEQLPDIACTVAAVAADDQNYTSAITGGTFTGTPEDDFSVEVSRKRIFAEHLASLDRATATLDGLEPANDLEKELVQAAVDDVKAARTLATNDRDYAPGDPTAPIPEVFPTHLDEAVEQSSQDIKNVFGICALPADVQRRQRAYGG